MTLTSAGSTPPPNSADLAAPARDTTTPGATTPNTRAPETTIGVTGLRPRWSVSAWGAVSPWLTDDHDPGDRQSPVLDWYVAADDRWHVPANEPSVRQRRIEGTPVVETRLRIPDGDAIQRVWAVPEAGGTVVMEFENESPLPIAVSVAGMRVITERPSSDVPIQGIDLPDDAIVLPVGHHATVRVLLASSTQTGFVTVPPPMSVVRGWTRVTEQASRLVLPDEVLVDAVNAARCDLLLEGPVDPLDDPIGFLLDVAELVRCGDSAEAWLIEIVEPVERVARRLADSGGSAADRREALDAVRSARLVAVNAGDDRAAGDLQRLAADLRAGSTANGSGSWWRRKRRTSVDDVAPADSVEGADSPLASFADLRRSTSVGRFVRSIERRIVDAVDEGGASLLPGGVPTAWLGTNFEVHGLPTGPASTVSFAVRWHGERPAVLWEQHDGAVRLDTPTIDPDWSTSEQSGETLWAAPPVPKSARSSLMVTAVDDAASESHKASNDGEARPSDDSASPPRTGILSVDPDGGSFA